MVKEKIIPILSIALSFLLLVGNISVYSVKKNPETSQTVLEIPLFEHVSPESQGISPEAVEELSSIVRSFYEEEMIVGAEFVIIKNRKTVLHEAVGWKDRENSIPMERNMFFNIRSMTKPITGSAIQILIDEGELRLDSRVAEYLPGFNNDNSEMITVGQLLTHRSGLPLSILTAADEFETLRSMADEIGVRGPEFIPGIKFWYSDAGSEALGAIVEAVTDESLDAYVTENILEPLAMKDTLYYIPKNQNDSRIARIASLYAGGVGEWVKIWSPEEPLYPFAFGSQSLYCTPLDYARFLSMWMDDGYVGWKRLLSPEAVTRTLTPISKMKLLGSDLSFPTGFWNLEVNYGQMAIIHSEVSPSGILKVKVIGHNGSDGTYAWAWPELDLIILYFTQSRGSTSGIKLESKIEELLIHPEVKEINSRARVRLAPYLGRYTANFGIFRNTEFIVTVQNGCLALDIPNQFVFELEEQDEEGKWYSKIIDEIAVSFDLDDSGNITSMKLHEAGYTFELPKGQIQEEKYPEDLDRYLGFYQTEDPEVVMEVIIKDGRLALDVPGQTAFELYPPDDEGKWYFRVNPTVAISFDESDDGRILSITIYLPDGSTYLRARVDDYNNG